VTTMSDTPEWYENLTAHEKAIADAMVPEVNE
jgi:hypothetical protein